MKIRESTVHYYVQSFIHIADQCHGFPLRLLTLTATACALTV